MASSTSSYNLSPWLCLKQKYMMLSMMISGPRQPENDIDVYLSLLIEDLRKLWDEGVVVESIGVPLRSGSFGTQGH